MNILILEGFVSLFFLFTLPFPPIVFNKNLPGKSLSILLRSTGGSEYINPAISNLNKVSLPLSSTNKKLLNESTDTTLLNSNCLLNSTLLPDSKLVIVWLSSEILNIKLLSVPYDKTIFSFVLPLFKKCNSLIVEREVVPEVVVEGILAPAVYASVKLYELNAVVGDVLVVISALAIRNK